MSNISLDSWRNWKNGILSLIESSNTNKLLLVEVAKEYIDPLKSHIRKAESGEFKEMAFNDIFGEPTPGKPTTRMIMPYGNMDIETMKFIMIKLLVATKKEYKSNSKLTLWNINWNTETKQTKQKYKPLGWLPGDPILEKDKEVASLSLKIIYTKKEDADEEVKVDLGFVKLLAKYLPQYVDWWQGSKEKQMTAKQSFFLSNPNVIFQLIVSINNMYPIDMEIAASEQQPKAGDDMIVVLSRHPIDVLRMSDFKNIQSCHSPDGEYFAACRQEAKRTGGGGGVLYTIAREDFDKKFPDGKLPQTGEIFSDSQRGVKDLLPDPKSRLRVRLVTSKAANGEIVSSYAVPDHKIYGEQVVSFRTETMNFFANKQKEKFVDPTTKELKIPEQKSLTRFGGSYEDPGNQSVANNFLRFIKSSLINSGITLVDINKNKDYIKLSNSIEMFEGEIPWAGSEMDEPNREAQLYLCQQTTTAISLATRAYNIKYNQVSNPQPYVGIYNPPVVDCEGDKMEIKPFKITITLKILKKLLVSVDYNLNNFQEGLRSLDWGTNYSDLATTLDWPDIHLDQSSVTVNNTGGAEILIQIQYSKIPTSADHYKLLIENLTLFQKKVTLEQYTNEITAKLEHLGFLAKEVSMDQKPEADQNVANLTLGTISEGYWSKFKSTKLPTERTNRKITICVRKKSSLK